MVINYLIGTFQHNCFDSCKQLKKPFRNGKVSDIAKSLSNNDAFFWIMVILRNLFMTNDIEEGRNSDPANKHNNHNYNFTDITEFGSDTH